jgi:hypothetical protein
MAIELDKALVAEVGVERVVVGAGDDDVAHVVRAAEDLDAVVTAVVDVDVLDPGAGSDAAGGQALQLRIGRALKPVKRIWTKRSWPLLSLGRLPP